MILLFEILIVYLQNKLKQTIKNIIYNTMITLTNIRIRRNRLQSE